MTEDRQDDKVVPLAAKERRLAQATLVDGTQALREAKAVVVFGRDADLDAMKTHLAEAVVDQARHGARHETAPARVAREPIADTRRAIERVDVMETEAAHEAALVPEAEVESVTSGEALLRIVDESACPVERRERRPREPAREILAIPLDDRVQLRRVPVLQEGQLGPIVHAKAHAAGTGQAPLGLRA